MIFFDIIKRFRSSILGVAFLYVGIFVWSNWYVVETSIPQPPQEEIVAVLDFSKDPIPVQELPPDPTNPVENPNNSEMKNVSANVTQEKTTYTNSFSKAQAEKEVWEELKAMEAAEFNALKSDNPTEIDKKDPKEADNSNPNLVKKGVDKNDKAGYGMDVQAVVSYYLKDRNVLSDMSDRTFLSFR